MINKERLVSTFINMVKISSPSLKERAILEYIKKELDELGIEYFEDSVGEIINGNCGNLIATIKGNKVGKKLLFTAHMDTVVPCDNVKPVIENDIIKSDGTTVLGGDDKAGIANILEAIKVIKENNISHPDLVLVFSIAEEIGLMGARYFDIEKYAPDYSFVLDSSAKPGEGIVLTPYSAKGVIKVKGRPAHAGIEPEKGINALVVAANAIAKLKLGRIDNETTANIGIVRGGEAVNIVMPEVEIHYEARSFSSNKLDKLLEETNNIFEIECKKFNAELENGVIKKYAGYSFKDTDPIIQYLKNACEKAGLKYSGKSTGGGSDANIYNEKGYKSVTLGIGMTKVHTTEEYIKIDDLINTTKVVVNLIKG